MGQQRTYTEETDEEIFESNRNKNYKRLEKTKKQRIKKLTVREWYLLETVESLLSSRRESGDDKERERERS